MSERYTHDCGRCVFLGEHGEYDLYFHEGTPPVLTTVIARYGNEGGNYMSGLAFAGRIPELAEARRRAIARGFGSAIEAAR